jgi:hypothetical protein
MERRAFLRGTVAVAGLAALSPGARSHVLAKGTVDGTSALTGGTQLPQATAELLPADKTAFGAFQAGAPWNPDAMSSFETTLGSAPRILNWFQGWTASSGTLVDPVMMANVANRGSIPMITWEPWNWVNGTYDTSVPLRRISSGKYDTYIRRWARDLKAFGKPVFLRFAQEMNGSWYPWCAGVNGNRASDYVAAWRKCVNIFRNEKAMNVHWVWCPTIVGAGSTPIASLYPGDSYVDYAGFDGYNGGTALNWGGWLTFAQLFANSIFDLRRFTTKPVIICEVGCAETGGDKAAWVKDMLTTQLPGPMASDIRAVLWFNQNKEADWRVESSTASLAAFRESLGTARYA